MDKSNLMKLAHLKTKRIVSEFNVDYRFQLSIFLKRLHYTNNLKIDWRY